MIGTFYHLRVHKEYCHDERQYSVIIFVRIFTLRDNGVHYDMKAFCTTTFAGKDTGSEAIINYMRRHQSCHNYNLPSPAQETERPRPPL